MQIAIDVTALHGGHQLRGTGVYVKNLVSALEKYGGKYSYTYFTRKQKLPGGAGLYHFPYFDPFRPNLPLRIPGKTVLTVHDLIPLVFPEKFPRGFRGELGWQLSKRLALKASRIISDSESSKKDVVQILGYPKSKIDVVYLAPDAAYGQLPVGKPEAAFAGLSAIPFFIYTGDVNWNKNVPGLIRGFAGFLKKNQPGQIRLLLVGQAFLNPDLIETKAITSLVKELDLNNRVIFPGFLAQKDLIFLYNQAIGLVQPSFYEGFGLPVLEAMAAGCPVIAADNSSLSEIKGPALPVDAGSPSSIAQALEKLFRLDQVSRRQLVNAGKAWAAKFTWQMVAEETVKSYEKA
jgi:alpha-1,3-rhamnosyl/mannosyltransferase